MKEGPVDITKLNPKEVAKELTNRHVDDYIQIKRSELDGQVWDQKENAYLSPNVHKMVSDSEQMTYKIRDEILLAENPKQQKERIEFYIRLMMECNKLNNFHDYAAILMGLGKVSIIIDYLIDAESKTEFERASGMMLYNYKELRSSFEKAEGIAIPYMGVITKDLFALDDVKNTEGSLNSKKDFVKRKEEIQGKIGNQDIRKPILNIGDWPKGTLLDKEDANEFLELIKPVGKEIFWGDVNVKKVEASFKAEMKKKIEEAPSEVEVKKIKASTKAEKIKKIEKLEMEIFHYRMELPIKREELLNKLKESPKERPVDNIAMSSDEEISKAVNNSIAVRELKFPENSKGHWAYKEVVTTENTYLKDLYEICNHKDAISLAYRGVKVHSNEMNHSECMELINKVNELRLIQARFYDEIKSENSTIESVHKKFLELKKTLTEYAILYGKYGTKKIPSEVASKVAPSAPDFVPRILITPIQRFPRYKLLFETIVEETNKENEKYNSLQNLFYDIKEDTLKINYDLANSQLETYKESMTEDTIKTYAKNKNTLENTRKDLKELKNTLENTKKAHDDSIKSGDKDDTLALSQKIKSSEKLKLSLRKKVKSYEKIIKRSEKMHPNIKNAADSFKSVDEYKNREIPMPPPTYGLPLTPPPPLPESIPKPTPSMVLPPLRSNPTNPTSQPIPVATQQAPSRKSMLLLYDETTHHPHPEKLKKVTTVQPKPAQAEPLKKVDTLKAKSPTDDTRRKRPGRKGF